MTFIGIYNLVYIHKHMQAHTPAHRHARTHARTHTLAHSLVPVAHITVMKLHNGENLITVTDF